MSASFLLVTAGIPHNLFSLAKIAGPFIASSSQCYRQCCNGHPCKIYTCAGINFALHRFIDITLWDQDIEAFLILKDPARLPSQIALPTHAFPSAAIPSSAATGY